jgi:lipopolysaccharide export LptBFGC system permease protein LptF
VKLKGIVTLLLLAALLFGFVIFSIQNGAPWEKNVQKKLVEDYLQKKYHEQMNITKIIYDKENEIYEANVVDKANILFVVIEDKTKKGTYHDTYLERLWESELTNDVASKLKESFPKESNVYIGYKDYSAEKANIVKKVDYKESSLIPEIIIIIRDNYSKLSEDDEKKNIREFLYFLANNQIKADVAIAYKPDPNSEKGKYYHFKNDEISKLEKTPK